MEKWSVYWRKVDKTSFTISDMKNGWIFLYAVYYSWIRGLDPFLRLADLFATAFPVSVNLFLFQTRIIPRLKFSSNFKTTQLVFHYSISLYFCKTFAKLNTSWVFSLGPDNNSKLKIEFQSQFQHSYRFTSETYTAKSVKTSFILHRSFQTMKLCWRLKYNIVADIFHAVCYSRKRTRPVLWTIPSILNSFRRISFRKVGRKGKAKGEIRKRNANILCTYSLWNARRRALRISRWGCQRRSRIFFLSRQIKY